jgi:hypothetical protein
MMPTMTPTTDVLYRQTRQQARRGQAWSILTKQTRCLFALKSVKASCVIRSCSDGGRRPVPIAQIQGSEGRASDFDRSFNPLQDHTHERWLGIAAARQQGKVLPAVTLIQVRDVYFVQDGHHRISVARAFGQLEVDAEVTVWQVDGTLPWEGPALSPGSRPASLSSTVERVREGLRSEANRLKQQVLLSLHRLLNTTPPLERSHS